MKGIKKLKSKLKIMGSVIRFLWKRKLWWLIPFVIILLLLAILIIFAQVTGVGPFIYTLI